MILRVLAPLAAAIAFAPALAAQQDFEDYQRDMYGECMTLADRDADQGYDMAQTWVKTGGGLPAMHCLAVALAGLERYAQAGQTFEDLALAAGAEEEPLLPEIYGQGGNAYLLGEMPLEAYRLFTLGLDLTNPAHPERVELLIDRARASAMAGHHDEALIDLGDAERLAPSRAGIHVLKASAYRVLEEYDAAAAALERAFTFDPDNREALLERGNLRITLGDEAGARQDWLTYLRLYPNGGGADAVRRNLERLDVRVEDFTPEE